MFDPSAVFTAKVLIVDDEQANVRLLELMLRGAGYTSVTSTMDPRQVCELYKRNRYDLIVLDLLMPDMDGFQVMHGLREVETEGYLPVVVVTAHPEQKLRALQAGAKDFISKPFDQVEALTRIHNVLEVRLLLREAMSRAEGMEGRYRGLLEAAPDAMVVVNHGGEIVQLNAQAEKQFGYLRAELVGQQVKNIIPQGFAERLIADGSRTAADALAQQIGAGIELSGRRKDGSEFPIEIMLSPLQGAEGILVTAIRDITLRKRAERRLLESEEEYRLLFDSNPHPMWVFDVETLAFLAVNDAAVRLYGFSRDEFLGMTIKQIRPPEEVPPLLDYLATIPESPSLLATQVRHRKKDGSVIEIEGVSNPIEFRGRRARLVLANDVTEKRRLEGQLLQAQKMEAVGRLAGGVAHDFNNLLGVITGYSELLLKNLGPQHPGSPRVEQIQRAAQRAAGLTQQLLAFSRKQVWQPRILDLNEVVADVEKMLSRVIGEDIQLVTTPGAALGRIRADPGQLEQVLVNLAVNARDAMPRGGQLVLETANVALDEAYTRVHPEVQPGPFVMLSVRDTGEGMSAETQVHIFEPFFTTKEEGKGTGLGLATVFGIVQQSGASISVHSRLGVGTRCTIYFPRVEEAVSRPSGPPPDAPPLPGSETILLVEDAASLRVMIREILEGTGYTVLEASDAEDALLKISAFDSPIHLMLTDVVMPRMSGPDLAKSVRIARPGIKVLFMSGYTDEAMGRHGVLGAGTRFIQKPFAAGALFQQVREVLDEGSEPAST